MLFESIANSLSEYYQWEWERTQYFYSGPLSPGFLQLYFWIFLSIYAQIQIWIIDKDL